MTRSLFSLSLDLDDRWAYLKAHGDPGWAGLPTYLDVVVPRILDFAAASNVRLTFFIVGQDAALSRNRGLFRSISAAGHEVANHSFRHDTWQESYTEQEFEAELVRAEEAIEDVTGQRTVGFRAPGYSLCPWAPQVLARRGYLYDGSTLPTFLGPLARVYASLRTRVPASQSPQRRPSYGSVRDLFRRNDAHVWETREGSIVEIPVTTMPFLRVPIHATYVMYLAQVSETLAERYCLSALALCRAAGVQPSFLLHPVDFLDVADVPEMSFFPAMGLPVTVKQRILASVMRRVAAGFDVATMGEHAAAVARSVGGQVTMRARAIPGPRLL
jgi:peptidoglycan/xylan/chitin deacetylase (PgdA/CDA1 family)